MNQIIEQLGKIGIVPVVKLNRAEDAVKLAEALCQGGLPCAEITFRTEAAAESIHRITAAFPDMLVGAGTVLTTEQADAALEAGAKFIVSPGLNSKVVVHVQQRGCSILPGCITPGEIEQALELGLEVVKFFPAEAAGGLKMIQAMSAPYHTLKFMPTGGIHPQNLRSYLDFSKVIACGGSWMVPEKLIQAGDFKEIKKLTADAVKQMLGFSLAHIGLHSENDREAENIADVFENIFGFQKEDHEKFLFSGRMIEIMKCNSRGTLGHIGIFTDDFDRAEYYLMSKGIHIIEDSLDYDEQGNRKSVYLDRQIAGFALHLIQRSKE